MIVRNRFRRNSRARLPCDGRFMEATKTSHVVLLNVRTNVVISLKCSRLFSLVRTLFVVLVSLDRKGS